MNDEQKLSIAKLLYQIYVEGDLGLSKQIEDSLGQLGFSVEVDADPFGRMFLWDKILRAEVEGTSMS